MSDYKGSTKSEREALLAKVIATQLIYWKAVRALELSYGPDCEIDSSEIDFQNTNIEQIDEYMRDEGFHVVDVLSVGE